MRTVSRRPPDLGDTAVVTVIIPTRGSGRGLDRAIETACGQEDITVRLLVVVDGAASDEGDQAALQSLQSPHRVVVVTGANRPGPLRNVGLHLAETSLVAFLDDDDAWYPNKLRRQIETMSATRWSLVASNARRIENGSAAGLYFHSLPHSVRFGDLVRANWVITSSVLAYTDHLRESGGFPLAEAMRHCDDYAAWLSLAALHPVGILREPLLDYTVAGSESLSVADPASGEDTRLRVLRYVSCNPRVASATGRKNRRALRRMLVTAPPRWEE